MNPRVRLKTRDQKREDMNETVRKTRGRKLEYKNERTLTRGQKREDNSKLDYRNERTLIDYRNFRPNIISFIHNGLGKILSSFHPC
jgi:hypothetical protein